MWIEDSMRGRGTREGNEGMDTRHKDTRPEIL